MIELLAGIGGVALAAASIIVGALALIVMTGVILGALGIVAFVALAGGGVGGRGDVGPPPPPPKDRG